ASGFANEPSTDATIAANREWATSLIADAGVEANRDALRVAGQAVGRQLEDGMHDTVQIERFDAPQETVEVDPDELRELRQHAARSAVLAQPLPDAGQILEAAQEAQATWGAQPPKTRALRLRRAA